MVGCCWWWCCYDWCAILSLTQTAEAKRNSSDKQLSIFPTLIYWNLNEGDQKKKRRDNKPNESIRAKGRNKFVKPRRFFSFVGQDKCTSDRATRCFFLCEMISNQINTWACANGKEIFCRFGWRLVAKARRTENQFCTVGEKGEEEMKDFSLTIRSQSDQLWIASWTN